MEPTETIAAQGKPDVNLTADQIFLDAALFPKLVMLALLLASVAAIVVMVRKLRAGRNLAGGSAYISSLRAGGPLLGLIGGVWGLMNSAIGVANVGPVPLAVVLPGLVESLFVVLIGLITGVVAIACHWAVEARIDRQVLSA